MTTNVSGGCFKFDTESIGGTWTWTVRSNNLQGLGQLYEVIDIYTPWGPFTIAEIPLPGDVVTAMADSLTQVQDQLAPLLALVNPTVTTFNVTIVEGDSNQEVGTVAVMNSGAFGSFMTATATPDSQWLGTTPASVSGLGRNEQANFNISLLTATLLNSGSPYNGKVTIQDNRVPPTSVEISITTTVLPRPEITTSPTAISLTFISSTGVPGGAQQLTIENSGPSGSNLEYTVAKLHNTSNWMDFTPSSGGPLSSGQTDIVTISVDTTNASSLSPGSYTDTLRISSTRASNSPVDVVVTLTVT
jgi:hypothetical protein